MYQFFLINSGWDNQNTRIVIPIMCTLVFFVIYWFVSQSEKIRDHFYRKYEFDSASVRHIFFTKYFGFFTLGVAPALVCLLAIPEISLSDLGFAWISKTVFFSFIWTLGLCAVVIPLAYFSAKKPKNLINYPQIRARIWSRRTLLVNLAGWAVYLFGYEFLFRGVLLFSLYEPLGLWPAVAINIALYSATHIPKGLAETIGAIPLGLVLCILTLASGTIWIAVFVHVAMAWTNSLTALIFHPDIQYRSNEK
jgi:membrane protease YdiL (CAAX protease family)